AGLYYGNISFGTGLVYGLKVLIITSVGGYLSPSRAALGGAGFGMAESLWAGYFPMEWRDAWIFLFLVAMLVLIQPRRGTRQTASQSDFRRRAPAANADNYRIYKIRRFFARGFAVDRYSHARHRGWANKARQAGVSAGREDNG